MLKWINHQKGSKFLENLHQNEKVAVSDCSISLYECIISKKMGKACSFMMLNSDSKLIELLSKCKIKDLKTLQKSVMYGEESVKKANEGESNEAINLLKKSLKLNPFNSISLMSLGCIFANLGILEKAIQYLKNALELEPENERIKNNYFKINADYERVLGSTND